jgi:hypothetical protein
MFVSSEPHALVPHYISTSKKNTSSKHYLLVAAFIVAYNYVALFA